MDTKEYLEATVVEIRRVEMLACEHPDEKARGQLREQLVLLLKRFADEEAAWRSHGEQYTIGGANRVAAR